MRLSDKKTQALYNAISEAITDERIRIINSPLQRIDELDARLFSLQHTIWRRVHEVLNLEGAP